MPIDIQDINDDQIIINDKLVVKDTDGEWIAKIELTLLETEALYNHITKE